MALTDLQIRRLRSRDKEFEIKDAGGLCLRVFPSGIKSWIFRYTFEGIDKRMTLGRYPAVSLVNARGRHAAAARDVSVGIDPALKAKDAKQRQREEFTFFNLFNEYWEQELSKTPSAQERRRLLEKDALPVWKKRKISAITRRDGVLLIRGVRERAPVTANRLLGVLVRMFNFAAEEGLLKASPLEGMRRGDEVARSRVLTDDEIKALWQGIDLNNKKIDIFHPVKLALKAILLTGQRPGEVAAMTWDQIEGDWWVIPADKRKNQEENRVPILPLFRDVIDTTQAYSGRSGWVFASPRNADRPITRPSMSKAIQRHRAEMGIDEQFTPHDLRRTLRTRLAELGVTDIVAERLLGHKLGGVLGIYNRHSYAAEKQQALDSWERRLRSIVGLEQTPARIINIGER